MKNYSLFLKVTLGLVLIIVSLIGWKVNGSALFIGLLLLGLIKFLGALLYILTGKVPFKSYRKIIFLLLLGAVIGFVVFDLPSIYWFKIWTYHGDIPNPFSDFFKYSVETLGWGAFLIVFYDSYKLIHLSLDKEFHGFGLSHHKGFSMRTFSILGFSGIILFTLSFLMVFFSTESSWWPPTMAALGAWFMLENIEFRKTGKTLLLSASKGHLAPLLSIVASSLILGFIFEYLNIISPEQYWIYHGLPFQDWNITGVPIILLFSWAWMYIIFLSIYAIIYKKENLWR